MNGLLLFVWYSMIVLATIINASEYDEYTERLDEHEAAIYEQLEADRIPDVAINSVDRDGEYVLFDTPGKEYGLIFKGHDYSVRLSGYVKSDNFIDTRRIVGQREDWISLFPYPQELDVHGHDVNKRARFNMLAIETRLKAELIGPDIGEARSSGVIEIDFSGPWIIDNNREIQVGHDSSVNTTTLRHAFIKIEMSAWSFLVGQYWHPLVPPESSGNNTVTYQSAPFEPYSRNPQIRFTFLPRPWLECMVAAVSQLDFRSNGPEGFSSKYLRNAVVPNLHAQLRFLFGTCGVFGVGIDFKRLIPRLYTQTNENIYRTRQGVSSLSAQVYGKIDVGPVTMLGQITYASNLTEQTTLGGYGVSYRDPYTGHERYTPIATLMSMLDIYMPGIVEPGIVFGFVKNLGSHKRLYADPTKQGNDRFTIFGQAGGLSEMPASLNATDYVVGVSPRIRVRCEPVTFAAEVEWLRASYGDLTDRAKVINGKPVSNVRFIFAVYYNF